MPGTVWGTASNLTAKFRSAPCLPPNTDKPLTRGPVPRQPSSQPLSAQASPQQRSRVHRYNVTHTTKSNFAGLLRIHAAIDTSGERRIVDLNELIDEALKFAYHGARAQDQTFNITLERDFGEGIALIEVNPQDMTRVFLNLFSNGFYATTKRVRNGGDAGFVPMLKVTTRDTGDAVEIRVRDNGIGIPAGVRDRVFEPFFSTKPSGEGTGLGLSITYDIVTQQHGGAIAADSIVGEYSDFTIRLPRNP